VASAFYCVGDFTALALTLKPDFPFPSSPKRTPT